MACSAVTQVILRLWTTNKPSLCLAMPIFLFTFITLSYVCRNWTYSYYCWSSQYEVQQAVLENHRRLEEANNYFKNVPHLVTERSCDDVDVAIGITTINRMHRVSHCKTGQLGYLTQVAAKLHRLIRADTHLGNNKKIFLCNVDAVPENHTESVYLSQFIPMVTRYGNSSQVKVKSEVLEKEKDDYVFCMQHALTYKPTYVLIIQDDGLVRDDAFKVLENILQHQQERQAGVPWLFIKLFSVEINHGFSNGIANVLELAGVAMVGGSVSVLMFPYLLRMFGVTVTNSATRMLHFIVGAVYCVFVAISVGRVYFHKWRHISTYTYHLMPTPGCCLPASLYPAVTVTNLTDYLSSVVNTETFPLDFAIDRYASLNHLKGSRVEPNLAQHIGLASTLRAHSKEYNSVSECS